MKWMALLVALVFSTAASAVPSSRHFDADAEKVQGAVARTCIASAGTILEQDAFHVLCSSPYTGPRSAALQLLNPNMTVPLRITRYAIVADDSGTIVQVSEEIGRTGSNGIAQRQPFEGKEAATDMDGRLSYIDYLLNR